MFPDKYQKFVKIMTGYCQGFNEETGGGNYRLAHQLRVAENAYRICLSGEIPNVDEKIVVIAGLLHDVGRVAILKQNGSKTLIYNNDELKKQEAHEVVGQETIKSLLKNELTDKEIDLVCEAIIKVDSHNTRSSNNKVLYDADTLDELGTLNIFRMFTYSGITNRSLQETLKYWFEVDREKKLSKISLFFTKFAKKEAKRRINLQDKVMIELQNSGYNTP